MLYNLFFKAVFDQDYPNLGRIMQYLIAAETFKRIGFG